MGRRWCFVGALQKTSKKQSPTVSLCVTEGEGAVAPSLPLTEGPQCPSVPLLTPPRPVPPVPCTAATHVRHQRPSPLSCRATHHLQHPDTARPARPERADQVLHPQHPAARPNCEYHPMGQHLVGHGGYPAPFRVPYGGQTCRRLTPLLLGRLGPGRRTSWSLGPPGATRWRRSAQMRALSPR